MSRILALLTVLMLVPAIAAQGGQPVVASNAPVELKPQGLFQSLELPYEGRGTIYILNDGLVIVEVGGGMVPHPQKDEAPIYASKSFGLSVDFGVVRLVDAGGKWFLDKNGAMIKARWLLPSEVSVISFDQPVEPGNARESLLDISGDMILEFDDQSGHYYLEVVDEEGENVFTAAFQATSGRGNARAYGSSCEAHCPKGDCSTSCALPKAAICSCKADGFPHCECIPRPQEINPLAQWDG